MLLFIPTARGQQSKPTDKPLICAILQSIHTGLDSQISVAHIVFVHDIMATTSSILQVIVAYLTMVA
jgi:hypothetical protein